MTVEIKKSDLGLSANSACASPYGYVSSTSNSAGVVTISSNDIFQKYETRIKELSADNLKLSTQVLALQKKVAQGNTPLVHAEAKLALLQEALISVKVITHVSFISLQPAAWGAIVEALAASKHESVALDKLLAKEIKKALKTTSVKSPAIKKTKTVGKIQPNYTELY